MRADLRCSLTHSHATPHRAPTRCPAQAGKRWGDGTAKEEYEHVWEGSVMRHAARRFSLSGTAPPFRGGKVTATPYAPAALLVADRPFSPPRSPLECSGPRQAARRYGPLPRTPPPLLPLAHTPARHAHTRQTRRPALKRKRKKGMRRPAGETPRLCKPQRGAAIAEAVPKHNSKTRSGPGGLGGSLPDRRCTGLGTRR